MDWAVIPEIDQLNIDLKSSNGVVYKQCTLHHKFAGLQALTSFAGVVYKQCMLHHTIAGLQMLTTDSIVTMNIACIMSSCNLAREAKATEPQAVMLAQHTSGGCHKCQCTHDD